MNKSLTDCNVQIYTENHNYEKGKGNECINLVDLLNGQKLFYLRKKRDGCFLISVSGVLCRSSITTFNGFFFCHFDPNKNSILDFFSSLVLKLRDLNLEIEDTSINGNNKQNELDLNKINKNFLEILNIINENKNDVDMSLMLNKLDQIKNITEVKPSFYVPREKAIETIEKTIKLPPIKSVVLNFSDKEEIRDIEPDITYIYSTKNQIIPNNKTKECLDELDKKQLSEFIVEIKVKSEKILNNRLKNNHIYFLRKLAEEIENNSKDIKEIDPLIVKISEFIYKINKKKQLPTISIFRLPEMQTILKNCLRNNYVHFLRNLADEIEINSKDINDVDLHLRTVKTAIQVFQYELNARFDNFEKTNGTNIFIDKFHIFHVKVLNDIGKFNSEIESILKKNIHKNEINSDIIHQNIKDIIDFNLKCICKVEEEYSPKEKKNILKSIFSKN